MEIDFTPKSRKSRKKLRGTREENSTPGTRGSPENLNTPKTTEKRATRKVEKAGTDNKENEENLDAYIDQENGVYTVTCNKVEAEFHFSKYNSGGKSLCILYMDKWHTPTQFETLTGCKSKKYKQSFYINKKPLKAILENGDSSNHSSGRSTPLSTNSQNTKQL